MSGGAGREGSPPHQIERFSRDSYVPQRIGLPEENIVVVVGFKSSVLQALKRL